MHQFYTPLLVLVLASVLNSVLAVDNEQSTLLALASSSPVIKTYGSSLSSLKEDPKQELKEEMPDSRLGDCTRASSRFQRTIICALLLAAGTSASLLHHYPQRQMLRLPQHKGSYVPHVPSDSIVSDSKLHRDKLRENEQELDSSSTPTVDVFRTKPVAFGLWDQLIPHKEHTLDIYVNDHESPCYRITPVTSLTYDLSDAASGAPLARILQTTDNPQLYNYQRLTFQIQRYNVQERVYTTLYDVAQSDIWGGIGFLIASGERLDGPSIKAIDSQLGYQLGYQLMVMNTYDTSLSMYEPIAQVTREGDFKLFANRPTTVDECIYVAMAKVLELYQVQ